MCWSAEGTNLQSTVTFRESLRQQVVLRLLRLHKVFVFLDSTTKKLNMRRRAFSTTGCLGGARAIAAGNLLPSCEQQLVDGVTVDSSCNGELMDNAFIFTKKSVIYTEGSSPYTAQDGTCSLSGCRVDHSSWRSWSGSQTCPLTVTAC